MTAEDHLAEVLKQIDRFRAVRQNFIEYLAEQYLDGSAVEIAGLCDERFDRSGALLGDVRDAARFLREARKRCIAVSVSSTQSTEG